jgi:hypothetical protein
MDLWHSQFYNALNLAGLIIGLATGTVTIVGWVRRQKSRSQGIQPSTEQAESADTLRAALQGANAMVSHSHGDNQRLEVVNRALLSRELEVAMEAAGTVITSSRRNEAYARVVRTAITHRDYPIANRAATAISATRLRDTCIAEIAKAHLELV